MGRRGRTDRLLWTIRNTALSSYPILVTYAAHCSVRSSLSAQIFVASDLVEPCACPTLLDVSVASSVGRSCAFSQMVLLIGP